MKPVTILLLIVLFSTISSAAQYTTFIVEEKPVFLTYVVSEGLSGSQDLHALIQQKENKRKYYLQRQEDEEKFQRCLKKITKNWRKNIAPNSTFESKWINGFNEDIDKKFARDLWFKLRSGEDIC